MYLELKPDWEKVSARHMAWWQGEIIDRVPIQVHAPKKNYRRREVPTPDDIVERWTNVDYVLESTEASLEATFYGGEALPIFFPNLGPEVFAGFLGADLAFKEDTSWSVPLLKDWDLSTIKLDRQGSWWKLILELTRQASRRGANRYLVGVTDLHGGVQLAAALRDPQQLAIDMLDCPEQVHKLVDLVSPMWFDVFQGSYDITKHTQTGTTTWLPAWSPGRWYPVSCDFSCMISCELFNEFVLPDIAAQVAWLDNSIYHLDGPGAVRHLEALLGLEKLNGIQWVPGAGSAGMLSWLPLLRQVQAAGKLLHLSVKPAEVEPLLDELKHAGLMLCTWCASQDEAEDLVKLVDRKTKVK
jgi:hypothetical protein